MSYRIRWNETYYFYVFTLPNGVKKLGITYDPEMRKKAHSRVHQFDLQAFDYLARINYGWEAYLYEQVVKYRCERFTMKYKVEYFWPEIPIQLITDTFEDTRNQLTFRLSLFSLIHLVENSKVEKDIYKLIAIELGAYQGKIDRDFEDFFIID